MGRYIVRRLLLLIPVVLGVTLLTFLLIRIIPGDIVTRMMGVTIANNPETRALILAELGLDRPLLEQYVWWLGRKGHFSGERHWGVEACAIYWHYVDLVWIFFYPAIYLIGIPYVSGH